MTGRKIVPLPCSPLFCQPSRVVFPYHFFHPCLGYRHRCGVRFSLPSCAFLASLCIPQSTPLLSGTIWAAFSRRSGLEDIATRASYLCGQASPGSFCIAIGVGSSIYDFCIASAWLLVVVLRFSFLCRAFLRLLLPQPCQPSWPASPRCRLLLTILRCIDTLQSRWPLLRDHPHPGPPRRRGGGWTAGPTAYWQGTRQRLDSDHRALGTGGHGHGDHWGGGERKRVQSHSRSKDRHREGSQRQGDGWQDECAASAP